MFNNLNPFPLLKFGLLKGDTSGLVMVFKIIMSTLVQTLFNQAYMIT